jgi:hypothetical protein
MNESETDLYLKFKRLCNVTFLDKNSTLHQVDYNSFKIKEFKKWSNPDGSAEFNLMFRPADRSIAFHRLPAAAVLRICFSLGKLKLPLESAERERALGMRVPARGRGARARVFVSRWWAERSGQTRRPRNDRSGDSLFHSHRWRFPLADRGGATIAVCLQLEIWATDDGSHSVHHLLYRASWVRMCPVLEASCSRFVKISLPNLLFGVLSVLGYGRGAIQH